MQPAVWSGQKGKREEGKQQPPSSSPTCRIMWGDASNWRSRATPKPPKKGIHDYSTHITFSLIHHPLSLNSPDLLVVSSWEPILDAKSFTNLWSLSYKLMNLHHRSCGTQVVLVVHSSLQWPVSSHTSIYRAAFPTPSCASFSMPPPCGAAAGVFGWISWNFFHL